MAPTLPTQLTMSNVSPVHRVTEDTPVDYLEGCMEILVIYPNGKNIRMSFQRSMPMLDLLIHVASASKIPPSNHALQVHDDKKRVLEFKPSTPIGSLNAHTIYILVKNRQVGDRSNQSAVKINSTIPTHETEKRIRLQVHLPRNQLFVTRVSPRTRLSELLCTICTEKNLDPRKYELRHPVNRDERLRLSNCLDDYKLQEVAVVGAGTNCAVLSLNDLPAMKKSNPEMPQSKTLIRASSSSEVAVNGNEKKKRGIFGMFFSKTKKGSSMGDSSVSSDSAGDRSISPARSDDVPAISANKSSSPTPPSPLLVSKRLAEEAVAKRNTILLGQSIESSPVAKVPSKAPHSADRQKKRPAPPPPSPAIQVPSSSSSPACTTTVSAAVSVINKSNSKSNLDNRGSGGLPRQAKYGSEEQSHFTPMKYGNSSRPHSMSNLGASQSQSTSNLTQVSSSSNGSLSSVMKKRKAPAPPPISSSAVASEAISEMSETKSSSSSSPTTLPSLAPVESAVVVKASESVKQSGSEEVNTSVSSDDSSSSSESRSEDECRAVDVGHACVAEVQEEHVAPEVLYNIVTDAPVAVDVHEVVEQVAECTSSQDPTSRRSSSGESSASEDNEAQVAVKMIDDVVNEEESQELPIVWQYKIPDPPTPFQDVAAFESETTCSMSTDSLQGDGEGCEDSISDVDSKSAPLFQLEVVEPEECRPETSQGEMKKDLPVNVDAVEEPTDDVQPLNVDAAEEPTGDVQPVNVDAAEEPMEDVISVSEEIYVAQEERTVINEIDAPGVVLLEDTSGSTADEEELPPLPTSSPPCESNFECSSSSSSTSSDEEDESPNIPLRFSISTYGNRVESGVSYDQKLSRSESLNASYFSRAVLFGSKDPASITKSESFSSRQFPRSSDIELPTKNDSRMEPSSMITRSDSFSFHEDDIPRTSDIELSEGSEREQGDGDVIRTESQSDGTISVDSESIAGDAKDNERAESAPVVTQTNAPNLPINLEIIQQFQSVLGTMSDPQAKILQENFLRLQEQLLSWQLQSVAQTGVSGLEHSISKPIDSESDLSDTAVTEEIEKCQLKENAVKIQDTMEGCPQSAVKEEILEKHEHADVIVEEEQKRFLPRNPPQIKMETWKPGRPRSEIIDFSRSSSFNVPYMASSKVAADQAGTVNGDAVKVEKETVQTPAIDHRPSEAVEQSMDRPGVKEAAQPLVEKPSENQITEPSVPIQAAGHQPKAMEKDESAEALKSSILRRVSLQTPRPFEPRPVSLGIKRPNFVPMVIHPVPSVQRKIVRAPEVRGFAALPKLDDIFIVDKDDATSRTEDCDKQEMLASQRSRQEEIDLRNQLIQSSRRSSAEINKFPDDVDSPVIEEHKVKSVQREIEMREMLDKIESRRLAARPVSMPVSSSLILAASGRKSEQPVELDAVSPTRQLPATQLVSSSNDSTPKRNSLSSKFLRGQVDQRQELLDSIRHFSNEDSLRKTGRQRFV